MVLKRQTEDKVSESGSFFFPSEWQKWKLHFDPFWLIFAKSWDPEHVLVCTHAKQFFVLVPPMRTVACTHMPHIKSPFLLTRSWRRLATAVFCSVEIGSLSSPVNNSLTSPHAALRGTHFRDSQLAELSLIIFIHTWIHAMPRNAWMSGILGSPLKLFVKYLPLHFHL